jgi:hypothetical protein
LPSSPPNCVEVEYLIAIIMSSFSLLTYSIVYSVESQQMFQRNMSHPFSGSKNKSNKEPAWSS